MKRDTLKTVAGLIIIALIVVATFLYGNAQRHSHDNKAKTAQTSQSSKPKASGSSNKSTPATQAAKPEAQPKTSTTAPSSTPATSTPATSTGQVADTGGSNQAMPQTGPSELAFVPVALLGIALFYLRRSRRELAVAVRRR